MIPRSCNKANVAGSSIPASWVCRVRSLTHWRYLGQRPISQPEGTRIVQQRCSQVSHAGQGCAQRMIIPQNRPIGQILQQQPLKRKLLVALRETISVQRLKQRVVEPLQLIHVGVVGVAKLFLLYTGPTSPPHLKHPYSFLMAQSHSFKRSGKVRRVCPRAIHKVRSSTSKPASAPDHCPSKNSVTTRSRPSAGA